MRQDITEAKAKWRELVFEQGQSGLSVAAFCNQRGLRSWQFYEWKKRVRESETARFMEVQVAVQAEPVRSAGERSKPIEIRLRAGRSLIVEPGFDVSHLRALLTVLESEA
jgi:hypothetical protein